VKDLRIEEPAKPKENKPPQVPNDPAILGVSHLAALLTGLPQDLWLSARMDPAKYDEIFRM
jgi:hypothetical protein